ncbi:MAG: hypothetical protein O7G85_01775, partial [Planctomycetota bacterium]|nr:hypothetical protein [Planctomycetota bacterium]
PGVHMNDTYKRLDRAEAATMERRQRMNATERLLELVEYLSPSDRALLEAVYHRGMKPTELARAINARPRMIRSRVQRIVQRLNSPLFKFVSGHRADWPRLRREVGELIVLKGTSQRDTAAKLGVSLHRVRQEMVCLREQSRLMRNTSW